MGTGVTWAVVRYRMGLDNDSSVFCSVIWPFATVPMATSYIVRRLLDRPRKLPVRELPETIEGVVEYRKLKGLLEQFEKALPIGERGP